MAEFLPAISYVLANEGGYSNHPNDPGGETKYGICKRDHPTVDIKNLTFQQAEQIYQHDYWCYDDIRDQRVATKLLDMAVNMEGNGKEGIAVKLTQRAACIQFPDALKIDGELGPKTIAVINQCVPETLLSDMCELAAARYRKIVERKPESLGFLKGWLARAAKLPAQHKEASIGGGE